MTDPLLITDPRMCPDPRRCAAPDKGLIAPDVVLYLDLSIEESMKRGEFGNERYEKQEFQR